MYYCIPTLRTYYVPKNYVYLQIEYIEFYHNVAPTDQYTAPKFRHCIAYTL